MKNHYDICVAGVWYGYNYGSLLNGYAEYRLLKDMGKEVLMLQKPGVKENDPKITNGHNTRFIKNITTRTISVRYYLTIQKKEETDKKV